MNIDITKKYRYRSGQPARILCIDGPCMHMGESQPVISMDESGEVNSHFSSGRFRSALYDSQFDLIEIREPREFELAINLENPACVYSRSIGGLKDNPEWEIIRVREILD